MVGCSEVLLRIEGVNLDEFVFDTQDLSTIRGGGLLLLDVAREVQRYLESTLKDYLVPGGIRVISIGGSIGLFAVDLADVTRASELRNRLEEEINRHDEFGQATVVIDVEPMARNFIAARERTLAANRWRQMRAPTQVLSARSMEPVRNEVCRLDGISPAVVRRNIKGGTEQPLGQSVDIRRKAGNEEKRIWFYKREGWSDLPDRSRDGEKLSFAWSFDHIAIDGTGSVPRLDGKMAVIYLDGNGFSKIQDYFITERPDQGEERQRQFDETLRANRSRMLERLLRSITDGTISRTGPWLERAKVGGQSPDKRDLCRLETLLWGGDEIIWVVPAWKGWEVVAQIFDRKQPVDSLPVGDPPTGEIGAGEPQDLRPDWTVRRPDGTVFRTLTHAAGVVFCHHNAPIRRIKALARELAGLAKNFDRTRNLVAYQVLESFDHVGRDLDEYRRENCPPGIQPEQLLLAGESMAGAQSGAIELFRTEALPMRRLRGIGAAIQAGDAGEIERLIEAARAVTKTKCPDALDHLDQTIAGLGGGPAAWLHLLELRDYIAPLIEQPGEQT